MAEATRRQAFLTAYPKLAKWVLRAGWLELGQDGQSASLVRVLDEGGLVWESDDNNENIDEALTAADAAVAGWCEENDADD